MVIVSSDNHKTLNNYCYPMFDIPAEARNKLVPELNTVNNTINNGGLYMANEEPRSISRSSRATTIGPPSIEMVKYPHSR